MTSSHVVRVEDLVGDPDRVEARRVVGHRDRPLRREEVDPARADHQLLAGLRRDGVPRLVRLGGQAHVPGPVVRVPDDARVVMTGAAVVAELELLEADEGLVAPGGLPDDGQPVGGRGAEPSEPDDDVVDVPRARHWRTVDR